jgi:hypothetical protein
MAETPWRVTADGERQWRGADGNWYPNEIRAVLAGTLADPSLPRPPPTIYVRTRPKYSDRSTRIAILITLGVIAVIVVWVGISKVLPHAQYDTTLVSVQPISTKQAVVVWRIKNVGRKSGDPTCSVTINTANADIGTNILTFQGTVAPGDTVVGNVTLTVTNNDAGGANRADTQVSC